MGIDLDKAFDQLDNTLFNSDAIQSWIDCVSEDDPARAVSTSTQRITKRRTSDIDDFETQTQSVRTKRARKPLEAISANIMQDEAQPTDGRRRTTGIRGGRQVKPTAESGRRNKRRERDEDHEPNDARLTPAVVGHDPEQTPKAKSASRNGISLPPSLPPSNTSSARSRSPVKMAELDAISGGCQHERLERSEEIGEDHPLLGIKELVERIEDIWQGQAIVPVRFRDSLVSRYARQFRYAHFFDETDTRDKLGQTLSLEELRRFEDNIRHCIENQVSEAGWNHKYHYPTLERAVELSQYKDQLDVAVL